MATFLAKTVKFKSLIKQLSKDEYLTFMGKLFDDKQTDLISKALFKHFIQSNSNANNINQLNNINSTISEIIQLRKIKPKLLSLTEDIKLNTLPNALIGNIASFLTQKNYFRFSQTNRSMFIGCNSPNMLIKLNLNEVKDYSTINLSQFKSLKRLIINIKQFNEFKLPKNGEIILNELECIELSGNDLNDINIEPFMSENCINLENIKIVRFHHFGEYNNNFNGNKFWKLLTKFKNIETLGLICVATTNISNKQLLSLRDLYPNLTGLEIMSVPMFYNLVNMFGNNLNHLNHVYLCRHSADYSNINFNKLEQIALGIPPMKIINQILKTGQNIRALYLHTDIGPIPSPSKEELKIIIPKIFKCKLLEYIHINVNNQNYLLSVLNGIENGLNETKKYERKRIKIIINGNNDSEIDLKSVIGNIDKIIKLLQKSEINDFMFICDMTDINEKCKRKLGKNEISNELNNISSNINLCASNNGLYFVISNINCRLCGRKESLFYAYV